MSSIDQKASPKAPVTDSSGQPVEVVERDLEQPDDATNAVDEVITPTSTRRKEQDADTLEREDAAIERKLGR